MSTPQDGAASAATGGVLATTANIGNYYRSAFAVAPEGNLNIAFQLNPRSCLSAWAIHSCT